MDEKFEKYFAGDDFALELFKRDVVCALIHLIFCIVFFAMGLWEMGVYNLISRYTFCL